MNRGRKGRERKEEEGEREGGGEGRREGQRERIKKLCLQSLVASSRETTK